MTGLQHQELHNRSVLLVEDDRELAALVQEFLGKHGFLVDVESNGAGAARRLKTETPDLVILDVMLPGMNGMDVCRSARLHYRGPILMLTALDDDMDHMLGLELGADDYIIKPVVPRLLLARINAVLRRFEKTSGPTAQQAAGSPVLRVGSLVINASSRQVCLSDNNITVTAAEFDLLWLLAESAGEVVGRDEVLQRVRGLEYDGLDRSIDRRISRLRKKFGDDPSDPKRIKTVRGKGYVLCEVD